MANTEYKDKYSQEVRACVAWYLKEQSSSGFKKTNINTVLICVILPKQKQLLHVVQDREHIKQIQELLALMRSADPSKTLVPVYDNIDDQTPLKDISTEVTSIWKKALHPYICCFHFHFGNQNAVSFWLRIGLMSVNFFLGKWIQDNWASKRHANVFHDPIQEGTKVQVALLTNLTQQIIGIYK